MEEKLSQHDIYTSYTAKRHQLVCWQVSISLSWAVSGVCTEQTVGTELLIAALKYPS